MKNWYLATYKKTDDTYGTVLVLSDSEAKAEKHFKDCDMASVRIAAEDEICYYRSKGIRLWSFENNRTNKAGVSDRNVSLMLLLFNLVWKK